MYKQYKDWNSFLVPDNWSYFYSISVSKSKHFSVLAGNSHLHLNNTSFVVSKSKFLILSHDRKLVASALFREQVKTVKPLLREYIVNKGLSKGYGKTFLYQLERNCGYYENAWKTVFGSAAVWGNFYIDKFMLQWIWSSGNTTIF